MINLLVCCYCLLQFYYVFNSLCYQVLEHIDNNHMFFIPSVAKYWSKYNFMLADIKKNKQKILDYLQDYICI